MPKTNKLGLTIKQEDSLMLSESFPAIIVLC